MTTTTNNIVNNRPKRVVSKQAQRMLEAFRTDFLLSDGTHSGNTWHKGWIVTGTMRRKPDVTIVITHDPTQVANKYRVVIADVTFSRSHALQQVVSDTIKLLQLRL